VLVLVSALLVNWVKADHARTDDDAIYALHVLVLVSALLVNWVKADHARTDDDAIYALCHWMDR